MNITKAVITAAGRTQRSLPLQTLIDRDGRQKSVLGIIVEEVLRVGIDEICIVVHPGDEGSYADVVREHAARVRCVPQREPLGYGHAIYCAREFVGHEAFLHLVGDHLYVSRNENGCALDLIELAKSEECTVSAVQATREGLLPHFGAIGGKRLHGKKNIFRVETVLEKPTPTEAEQSLLVPGLRAGYYLCFFGMHVLTESVMEILGRKIQSAGDGKGLSLSAALADLARREQYLAIEKIDSRYDVGATYGLLNAQLAVALSGVDREEVMTMLLDLFAQRDLAAGRRGSS
jgi:UTP--glucose-1-phosphate uridylyltransferase